MKKILLSLVALLAFSVSARADATKRYIWQNDGSNGAVNWNGVYRFTYAGNDGNGECLTEFSWDDWAAVKDGKAYLLIDAAANANVRITTGWWTSAYGGTEHNCIDMAFDDAETGLKYIPLDFKTDGNLYDNLDVQHLLFTGQDYTPMGLYVLEGEIETPTTVRTSFWVNGVQSTIPAPNWTSEGRFCRESSKTGEETYAFTDEQWEELKAAPFRIAIEKLADWVNLRFTTGWWRVNFTGLESLNDLIRRDIDGTYYVEINLADDPEMLSLVDEQHILFTGEDYKLLEIYQIKEVSEEDGIQNVTTTSNSAIYNISGQRISSPKGLYIQNGKKYFAK